MIKWKRETLAASIKFFNKILFNKIQIEIDGFSRMKYTKYVKRKFQYLNWKYYNTWENFKILIVTVIII